MDTTTRSLVCLSDAELLQLIYAGPTLNTTSGFGALVVEAASSDHAALVFLAFRLAVLLRKASNLAP